MLYWLQVSVFTSLGTIRQSRSQQREDVAWMAPKADTDKTVFNK